MRTRTVLFNFERSTHAYHIYQTDLSDGKAHVIYLPKEALIPNPPFQLITFVGTERRPDIEKAQLRDENAQLRKKLQQVADVMRS